MSTEFLRADDGMATVEYVLGTLTAAALALILMSVVKGTTVSELLRSVFEGALKVT